jgi:hypothetical protein
MTTYEVRPAVEVETGQPWETDRAFIFAVRGDLPEVLRDELVASGAKVVPGRFPLLEFTINRVDGSLDDDYTVFGRSEHYSSLRLARQAAIALLSGIFDAYDLDMELDGVLLTPDEAGAIHHSGRYNR